MSQLFDGNENGLSTLPKQNVIVVGAGLAGLAVSLGLANSGLFTVDLVEKEQEFTKRGATLKIRPNGLRALKELCPDDLVVPTLQAHSIELPPPRMGLLLPWATFRDSLLDAVRAKSDSITLHMGLNLCQIDDSTEAGSVQATFQRLSSDDKRPAKATLATSTLRQDNDITLQGRFLLACDGVSSAVRHEHLHLPPAVWTGVTFWRGSVMIEPLPSTTSSSKLLTPLLEQGLVPLGARMYGPYTLLIFNLHLAGPGCLAWVVTTHEQTEIKTDGARTSLWSLLEPYIEYTDERSMIHDLLSLSNPADLYRASLLRTINPSDATHNFSGDDDGSNQKHPNRPGWGGRGRVTLLGDAAHAMSPVTGVGPALAFEDCVVLCRHLRVAAAATAMESGSSASSSVFEDSASVATILHAFEEERLPRVRRIWDQELQTSESIHSSLPQSTPSIAQPLTPLKYDEFVNAGV